MPYPEHGNRGGARRDETRRGHDSGVTELAQRIKTLGRPQKTGQEHLRFLRPIDETRQHGELDAVLGANGQPPHP